MSLLQLSRLTPDDLLLRKDVESVGVYGSCGRVEALRLEGLSILEPHVLAVVVVDIDVERRLEDRLTGNDAPLALSLLGLGDPLFARQDRAVFGERCDGVRDDGVDLTDVAFLLLETCSRDPDLGRGWYYATGFVEDLSGLVGSLEACEREPELDRVGDDLDGAREQDSGVFRVLLQLDRLLPQLDRRRDVLECCTEDK